MSINIGKYTFDGPYATPDYLEYHSGIYAIIDEQPDSKYYLIDVGESASVRTRVETHDRKDCWERNRKGVLTFAVYYTPNLQQPGRMAIEQEIRNQFSIPCGQR